MAGKEQLLPCNLSVMKKVWLEPFTSSEAILFSCGHQPLLRPQTVPCVVQCNALQHSHALAQPVLMPSSSLSPSASKEQSSKGKQLQKLFGSLSWWAAVGWQEPELRQPWAPLHPDSASFPVPCTPAWCGGTLLPRLVCQGVPGCFLLSLQRAMVWLNESS